MNSFDDKPMIVLWELTQACDLACKHCRAEARPGRDPRELTFEEGCLLLDEIAGWKSGMVVMTGGDPLKHPHFWDWILYARQIGVAVSVTPSATPLLTHEAVERMRLFGVKRIALSLDGGNHRTHDRFRGVPGSFEKVVEIAAAATHNRLPLQINTTLTPHNVGEIEAMGTWVRALDAVLWSVFFLVPVGRGKYLPSFTASEFENIFARLFALERDFGIAIKTTEAPHYRRFQAQHKLGAGSRGRGTGDGRGIVFVSHTGKIYPSGFLPLAAGSVRTDSLQAVYARSPLFRALRAPDLFKGKCGVCEFRHMCGGSRARAFALTGDPRESDPSCSYVPNQSPAVLH